MKKTTLVIMAAGIGSRFGGGIKQLEPLGPNGEVIMEYSIHDALEAGFNKVVFIIRKEMEDYFKEVVGNKISGICEVAYAYQDMEALPQGFKNHPDRKKPWGTGQAVLSCKGIVNEPFMVINADDYYGKEAFKSIHEFLVTDADPIKKYNFCMAGFILKNTLSDNGGVTRGVCEAGDDGYLTKVVETGNIVKYGNSAGIANDDGTVDQLDENCYVSMNMWGLTPDFIDVLEKGFVTFLSNPNLNQLKGEYLLPTVIGDLVESGEASVKILETNDKWFGVTYGEDKYAVKDAFLKLQADGVYPKTLY
ncbi:MAG: nucleotidyltransferase [Ruminococcaceae bacterium]|nr:nucleotidyltransferase [Oscillospiraceae bacterium]